MTLHIITQYGIPLTLVAVAYIAGFQRGKLAAMTETLATIREPRS